MIERVAPRGIVHLTREGGGHAARTSRDLAARSGATTHARTRAATARPTGNRTSAGATAEQIAAVVSGLTAAEAAPCAGRLRIDHAARRRCAHALHAAVAGIRASDGTAVQHVAAVVDGLPADIAAPAAGRGRIHHAYGGAAAGVGTMTGADVLPAIDRAATLGVGHEPAAGSQLSTGRRHARSGVVRDLGD